jgi:hypothetical protein
MISPDAMRCEGCLNTSLFYSCHCGTSGDCGQREQSPSHAEIPPHSAVTKVNAGVNTGGWSRQRPGRRQEEEEEEEGGGEV